MISYRPFYETLYRKNISEYQLIFTHGVMPNTLQRMRHQKPSTTTTLNTFGEILDCPVSDVIEYVSPEDIE